MDAAGRRQWERVLLLLAALLGVVAMHAGISPTHDQAGSMAADADPAHAHSLAHDLTAFLPAVGSDDSAATASSSMPGNGPMSTSHSVVDLCLAVMTAGALLGLLVIALTLLLRRERSPRPPVVPATPLPPRPPAPHAVRLAQLCVLRN